jgi:trans-L-3-hydroxyproline dehydratase
MEIRTLDYHTAGEPLRIVTAGLPDIPGEDMQARRRFLRERLDGYRRLLMLEPRGHADMYGAVPTPPATPDGDVGVLFMHNEGCSTMCGHGIIALVTAGLEQGLFAVRDPDEIRIDTPAGRVVARARLSADGRVAAVAFRNVPSFVLHERLEVQVDKRSIVAAVAFGGAFYAYVDAADFGFEIVPAEAAQLVAAGTAVSDAVRGSCEIRHPAGKPDLDFLYGTIFVRAGDQPWQSRNACVFAAGALDRSPTGTGVSGRAAIQHARGELGLGESLTVASVIGTVFEVRCLETTMLGDIPAVIPEVSGSAHCCGESRFLLDDRDPLRDGFLLR